MKKDIEQAYQEWISDPKHVSTIRAAFEAGVKAAKKIKKIKE